jgi:hypothetical protein
MQLGAPLVFYRTKYTEPWFTQFVSLPCALAAAFSGKHLHLPRLLLQFPQKITGECDLVDTSVPGRRPLGGRERDSRSATGPLHARNYIVERIAPFAHLIELRLKAGNVGIGRQKLYLDRQVERHRGCLFLGTNDTGTSHQRFFFGLRADEAPGFFGREPLRFLQTVARVRCGENVGRAA